MHNRYTIINLILCQIIISGRYLTFSRQLEYYYAVSLANKDVDI